MPMHLAGTAMTWGSVWLLTPLIPVATLMTIATSNPGMIHTAGEHWGQSKAKLEDYKKALEDLKKKFDSDSTNWTADDKVFFDNAVENYIRELDKLNNTVNTVEGLAKLVAKILFYLCIAVLTVGTAALALTLATIPQLAIPVIGEAAYVAAMSIACTIMEVSMPVFANVQAMLVAFGGLALGVAGGAWGSNLITLGAQDPNFKEVKIEMPSGPLK
ncbi:hypothetical protein D0T12_21595 [Actinomadura spongiicola]|uniref:Uncharacterized protein n=1 Tax=Actinomadura spongiicola TaxID=2303421 RepID=A0A372GE25_9ACTN|nr:hypothetical protein [Actinomadura spongiicola]RFS83616.1 hypothetical protein D0T12_21595 [Actinomadura spongiicola]